MANKNGPVIDMTPDGRFIEAPRPPLTQILLRVLAFAVALCIGAALVWTAFLMIPVLLVLGFAAYVAASRRPTGWGR